MSDLLNAWLDLKIRAAALEDEAEKDDAVYAVYDAINDEATSMMKPVIDELVSSKSLEDLFSAWQDAEIELSKNTGGLLTGKPIAPWNSPEMARQKSLSFIYEKARQKKISQSMS